MDHNKNFKSQKKSIIDYNSDTTCSQKSNKSSRKVYCVCKSSDTNRFMIACDRCPEWFHGDCVGITEAFSKKIKTYYCYLCRDKNSKLAIKFKKKFNEQEIREKFWKEISQQENRERELLKKFKERNSTKKNEKEINSDPSKYNDIEIDSKTNLLNTTKHYGKNQISGEDIENFVSAIVKFGTESLSSPTQDNNQQQSTNSQKHKLENYDNDEQENNSNDDDEYKPPIKTRQNSNNAANALAKLKKKRGRKKKPLNINSYDDYKNDDENQNNCSLDNVKQDIEIRQCLGPACVNATRFGSKYCCDECGIHLASIRISNYLKENNLNDKKKIESDVLNEQQLHEIECEIELSKTKLKELDKKTVHLDSIMQRIKFEKINENSDIDKETEEIEIFCVTCGHSYNERHALKHMERCFSKNESQAFFGSFFKSHPEAESIFCDYFNQQTKMYCKRLKSMCPEHEKEKKINEDEVCGCPLFNKKSKFEDSNEICLSSKRNCQLHFKWEKLRRAQIDLEKLHLWMKLDELYEQKRLIEIAISNRSGLLGCMLHKTTVH